MTVALESALEELRVAEANSGLYPAWFCTLCFGTASAGVALSFFGGGWWDGAASFLLGCAVGALGFLAGRNGEDRRLLYAYEFLAAAMCSLVVRSMDVIWPTCYEAVVLSALIWLLQGWTMTLGIVEIATYNPITGVSHFFRAVIVTAMMGYGLDIGNAAASALGLAALSDQSRTTGACSHKGARRCR